MVEMDEYAYLKRSFNEYNVLELNKSQAVKDSAIINSFLRKKRIISFPVFSFRETIGDISYGAKKCNEERTNKGYHCTPSTSYSPWFIWTRYPKELPKVWALARNVNITVALQLNCILLLQFTKVYNCIQGIWFLLLGSDIFVLDSNCQFLQSGCCRW